MESHPFLTVLAIIAMAIFAYCVSRMPKVGQGSREDINKGA